MISNNFKTSMITLLQGILLDGKFINLGAPRAEVESLIGAGESYDSRVFYYNNELRIDYNSKGQVELIEFLGGIDGQLQPVIDGVPVFKTKAEDICELLRNKDSSDTQPQENAYDVTYPSLGVGLYRDITPSVVEEMIQEMEADGIDPNDNEDVEMDKRRANHWATIGIGSKNYYSTTNE